MIYKLVAPCLFGVEGLLSDELKRLGALDVLAGNGRVAFSGDSSMIAKVNIGSRLAERVLILISEFDASTFESLFEGVKSLPFDQFIDKDDAFPVTGWSISSKLFSIPDCQSIIKKAVVERLKQKYKTDWFEETGTVKKIRFSILKNKVSLMLDTSGEPLHKRGYRKEGVEAPIKETLASALCMLARIFPDTALCDPFCGSGTILIEAAMIAKNMAPGLKRRFAAEKFEFIGEDVFRKQREAALGQIRQAEFKAYGSDIDEKAVELTLANAKKAGVDKLINAKICDVKDLSLPEGRLKVITNPPYGERLLNIKAAEDLYSILGEKLQPQNGKGYFIISASEDFERYFGRIADKKRKLYNGMLKCDLYMFFAAVKNF